MKENNVILNKIETIERCINRIKIVYENNPDNLKDYTKQDSIMLNIQRACEASIDLAMHIISVKRLGIPQNSRDAFEVLNEHKIIDDKLSRNLKAMVGFRNIVVHDYQSINIKVVQSIISNNLNDFYDYIYCMNKYI